MLIHKFIKKAAIACAFSSLLIFPAMASTWNTFAKAFNSETALFFFDADTVQKQAGSVTIWVKYVNTIKPESDGSWATALRYSISCSKRQIQHLSFSTYDKDGKFIRSNSNPGQQIDVTPDSINEEILTAVCQPDFPRNKSREFYFPVSDNDIFAHTKRFMEYLESKKDSAPK